MFTASNSKKDSRYLYSRYLSSPVYHCHIWWIQNWLQFEQHYSDSVSSISLVKESPATTIKVSATILNLVSFSLFDQCDSDKPEKINISLLSVCCLWTLHDHKTLGDKNWDEFTKPFFKKKNLRGLTPVWISLLKNSAMLVVNRQHVLEVGITIIIENKVCVNLWLSLFIDISVNTGFQRSVDGVWSKMEHGDGRKFQLIRSLLLFFTF